MTLDETLDSFTSARRLNLTTSLRDSLGCYAPDCVLELRIAAGSIALVAVVAVPDVAPSSGADASSLAASVGAAAAQLVAQPAAALTASLGVSVASAAPAVEVQSGVLVPLLVAPPPPTPPLPPQSPQVVGPNVYLLSASQQLSTSSLIIIIVTSAVIVLLCGMACALAKHVKARLDAASAYAARTVSISRVSSGAGRDQGDEEEEGPMPEGDLDVRDASEVQVTV